MADIGLTFWLTAWNFIPSIVVGCVVLTGLYFYALGPLRRNNQLGEPQTRGRMIAFGLGMLTIFLALCSPLDKLGDDYLFSAHMVQHLLIMIVAPALLLIGIPTWFVTPLLRYKFLRLCLKVLTLPAIAFTLYFLDFFLWHAPPLYNATLENDLLHVFEHLTFIGFGFFFWWPVFSPFKKGEFGPLPLMGQVVYLFLSGMPTVLLGAGLTFFPPLYAPYLAAPRVWGISPALDQQLGGLIMWIPGQLLVIVLVCVLGIRWMQRLERKQEEQEAFADEQLAREHQQVG